MTKSGLKSAPAWRKANRQVRPRELPAKRGPGGVRLYSFNQTEPFVKLSDVQIADRISAWLLAEFPSVPADTLRGALKRVRKTLAERGATVVVTTEPGSKRS
jgi:hypothetical protein